MSYENHPAIIDALERVRAWVQTEGGNPLPAAVAREIVKTLHDPKHQARCRIAAFSLILGGLELSAGNLAWLIRDAEIGFPERPTFAFVRG